MANRGNKSNKITATAAKNTNAPTAVKDKNIISNFVRLDAKNPIPLETNGIGFYSKAGRNYVPFLEGQDNMPSIMLEAKLLSPTTLACINSKIEYSIGQGYKIKDVEEDKDFDSWAKVVNKKGESFNDILRQFFDNNYSYGNVFIEVVKVTVGKTKYVKLFVKSVLDCRLVMPADDDIPTEVYISKEFRKSGIWNTKKNDMITLPIYTGEPGQKWFVADDKSEHAIIWVKNSVSGYDYYGMPSNIASLPQQILEYKGARYNLDNFENNLVLGGVIVLQGQTSQEEADKLGKNIVQQHSGDGKRGRYVILNSEQGIENSKILQFEKQKDGDFIEYDRRLEEKIIAANNWDSVLAGLHQSGKLGSGGTAYIRSIYDIKKNTVIEPAQAVCIEKFINPLMRICDEFMGKKWSEHEFGFISNSPVSFLGDLDINSLLSVDEGRELIGKIAFDDERGKQLISTAAKNNKQAGEPGDNKNEGNNV